MIARDRFPWPPLLLQEKKTFLSWGLQFQFWIYFLSYDLSSPELSEKFVFKPSRKRHSFQTTSCLNVWRIHHEEVRGLLFPLTLLVSCLYILYVYILYIYTRLIPFSDHGFSMMIMTAVTRMIHCTPWRYRQLFFPSHRLIEVNGKWGKLDLEEITDNVGTYDRWLD